MPLFRYEALDRAGKKVVGAMQVDDENALTSRLAGMGYRPVMVEAAQVRTLNPVALRGAGQVVTATVHRTTGASAPSWTQAGDRNTQGSPLTASERSVSRMFYQLHIAVKAGMPLFNALATVTSQVPEKSLRQVLTELSRGVSGGQPLSNLMEQYPRLFTRGDVGTIRAGEMGGFLPDALQNLAALHEQDDNTRRRLRIWEWFFHSNVLTLFLFIPAALWIKDMVGALNVAAGIKSAVWGLLYVTLPLTGAYFGGLVAFYRMRQEPGFTYRWHGFLLRVPVVKRINYLRANAVFTRMLHQLFRTGISASTAWETAAAAVPNRFLSAQFEGCHGTVAATGRFSDAMQQTRLLDPSDIGMVATGEVAGEISQALDYLASRYEEDTRVALGSVVVRGAITFSAWAFILGGIACAFFFWCYGQGLMKLSTME